MKNSVRVAISGAAGRIANNLLFSIASGQLLGDQQPISLSLLETPARLSMLNGIAMELHDGVFPLLAGVEVSDDPWQAFEGADYVFLISSPLDSLATASKTADARMEQHGNTFALHGKALNDVASRDVKILVISNPVMINALMVQRNAPDLNSSCISALMRLDHNRAHALLAHKAGASLADVRKVIVWGNHSSTQYPDFYHATIGGVRVDALLENDWLHQVSIGLVRQRGYAVIDAYGGLRAASSAAKAAIDHMRDWIFGTRDGDWTSMGVLSDGSYGIPSGIFFGFPVVADGGQVNIVQGLQICPERLEKIHHSADEIYRRCQQFNLL
ncbi:malate dehydrogenase [Chromobacterium vaccinii]|uniref:MDH/LDH-like protein n=1 Tax=Chromobacterium vaccinii TaxID=1108595 RepID=A0A7S9SW80_9NEIS|nr:malate dehydrogenase [Chromobacterium vaccinii]QPI18725.1 MDH/LDH-like protein [Chromobacterium vaccinii]UTQ11563.1 malate dehydrogenase [Chromobacterium vaccinii]